jgi:molybdopterin converting factor small subunit
MSVTVKLRGPIKTRIESPQFDINLDDSTILGEVLQKLIEISSEVRRLWSTPDLIDRDALVLLNETDIGLTGGLVSRIDEGDVIVILPLVHGG